MPLSRGCSTMPANWLAVPPGAGHEALCQGLAWRLRGCCAAVQIHEVYAAAHDCQDHSCQAGLAEHGEDTEPVRPGPFQDRHAGSGRQQGKTAGESAKAGESASVCASKDNQTSMSMKAVLGLHSSSVLYCASRPCQAWQVMISSTPLAVLSYPCSLRAFQHA